MYAQSLDPDQVEKKILSYINRVGVKTRWLKFLADGDPLDRHLIFRDIGNFLKLRFAALKALASTSLEERRVLYEPLAEFLRDDLIENCKIPFGAVALDLKYGTQILLNKGPIINAVYASAAVRGVFPPLELDGHLLTDGGPVAAVPVEEARKLGARYVVAVDVSLDIGKQMKFANGLQVLLRADSVSQDRLRRLDLAMADVVVTPDVKSFHWANFSRPGDCIKRGEKAAEAALPLIRALGKTRPWWKRFLRIA